MKKNQLYRPENFDRPEDVEYKGQMKQEGMYDLPEDPLEKSCPTIPEGEKGQIYDDVENTPSPYTMLDIDTVTVASIYNLPDEEVSIKGGEKTEEKFYESIEDEDSNDEATKGKDKGLHWRGNLLQQEINELQIKEANQRRRLEVMQSKSSDVKVDFVKVGIFLRIMLTKISRPSSPLSSLLFFLLLHFSPLLSIPLPSSFLHCSPHFLTQLL